MRNRVVVALLIVLSLLLTCCNIPLLFNHKVLNTIYSVGKDIQVGQDTTIDVQSLFNSRLDLLYVSGEAMPPELISEDIGIKYLGPWVWDSEYRLILLKGHRIIYQENLHSSIENGLSLWIQPCPIQSSFMMHIQRINESTLQVTWN